MRERLTARLLLLDPHNRILLMKGRLPSDPGAPGVWFTIGGGVEAGESAREAAAREAREETGFSDVTIGDRLFDDRQIHHDRKGRPVLIKASFWIARCGGGEPSRDGWQALEREFVDDIRWWSLDELTACDEPVYPADLAARLAKYLTTSG